MNYPSKYKLEGRPDDVILMSCAGLDGHLSFSTFRVFFENLCLVTKGLPKSSLTNVIIEMQTIMFILAKKSQRVTTIVESKHFFICYRLVGKVDVIRDILS